MAQIGLYSKASTGEYRVTRGFMFDANNPLGGADATLAYFPVASTSVSDLQQFAWRATWKATGTDRAADDFIKGGFNQATMSQLRNTVVHLTGLSSKIEMRNTSSVPGDLQVLCLTPRIVTDKGPYETWQSCLDALKVGGTNTSTNVKLMRRAWVSPLDEPDFHRCYKVLVKANVKVDPGAVKMFSARLGGRYLLYDEMAMVAGSVTYLPGTTMFWVVISRGTMVAMKATTGVPDGGTTTFVHPSIQMRGRQMHSFQGFLNTPMVHDYQNMTFYNDDNSGGYVGYPSGLLGRDGIYRAFGNEQAINPGTGFRYTPVQVVGVVTAGEDEGEGEGD